MNLGAGHLIFSQVDERYGLIASTREGDAFRFTVALLANSPRNPIDGPIAQKSYDGDRGADELRCRLDL